MSSAKVWEKKSFWLILLGILCVAVVGLWIGIWFLNNKDGVNDNGSDEANEVVLADDMEGWDGQISESTKALVFSEKIKDKLESDGTYNDDDADRDFRNAYDTADGVLKVYIAIEYAKYRYDLIGNTEDALEILEEVQEYIDAFESTVQDDLWYELAYYYEINGDTNMAEEYRKKIEENNSDGRIIDMKDVL